MDRRAFLKLSASAACGAVMRFPVSAPAGLPYQFVQSREFSRREICAVFRVPPELVGSGQIDWGPSYPLSLTIR
jgi:hypothetical protein